MSSDAAAIFLRALEAARDDEDPASVRIPTPWWTYAKDLLTARREDLDGERCPDRRRRLVHAAFDSRPQGVWERLASLVFDSWRGTAPAVRGPGATRLLRYECPTGSLDVEVAYETEDRVHLQMAVESAGLEPTLCVARGEADEGHALPLDAQHASSLTVAARDTVVLSLNDEDGEMLRTPPLPLA